MSIDVANKQHHIDALDAIISRFGRVDVLVNGAGINSPTPFLDLSLDEWNSVLDSQLLDISRLSGLWRIYAF